MQRFTSQVVLDNNKANKIPPLVPPPDGVIKVNFDAAFKTKTCQGALGVVLCNAQGQVVAARCNTTWVDS